MPTLERLLAGPHDVVAVVSQPDRPRGRGRRPQASPVSKIAMGAEIPLLRPERVAEREFLDDLDTAQPDLGIVAAFGQFLPRAVRDLPRLGYLINAHASLLPLYRGAAPIAHALLDGKTETGVSIMRIVREMDAGPVALVGRMPIRPQDNTERLSEALAGLAADLVEEAVGLIATGTLEWREQDHENATLAPRLSSEDAQLDWRDTAERLARRVRAMAPRPGAATLVEGEPLRILEAEVQAGATGGTRPGVVLRGAPPDPLLRIATGDGWLVPQRVQRAGGRVLGIDAFLRGREIPEGTRLGPPPGD